METFFEPKKNKIQIICSFLQMGIPTGYGLAVMSYVQMILMFVLGQFSVDRVSLLDYFGITTLIATIAIVLYPIIQCFIGPVHFFSQNDYLQFVVYDFKWYLLPVEIQSDIFFFLNRLERGVVYTMGPFGIMNYMTAFVVSFELFFFFFSEK